MFLLIDNEDKSIICISPTHEVVENGNLVEFNGNNVIFGEHLNLTIIEVLDVPLHIVPQKFKYVLNEFVLNYAKLSDLEILVAQDTASSIINDLSNRGVI